MNVRQPDSKRKYQNAMPEHDEGWWKSVLAEENRHASARPPAMLAKPKLAAPVKSIKTGNVSTPLKPESQINWEEARKLYDGDCVVEIDVTGHNHGGLLVEGNGLAGFVPFSHLIDLAGREHEADRDSCLEAYAGKTLKVKMIECVPEDGRVVFSERAALTPPGKRTELFHALHAGSQVTGTVTNVTDFGVFVDLGGVEGLIHLSELSWGRVAHPKQIAALGQEIKAQVLEMSAERNRVALSLKRLSPSPWARAASEFPVGRVLSAVVTSVLSYGAFARIEAGVEGLIHVSEMPLEENQTPRNLLAEGQPVQARVLRVDPARQRLGLSLRINQE